MDLYRYFHPHHNPRLHKIPVRMQELAELEQAAIELGRAVNRAEIRFRHTQGESAAKESFADMKAALDFVAHALAALTESHPGDDKNTLRALLDERKEAPGWEDWAKLVQQRLELEHLNLELELPPANGITR